VRRRKKKLRERIGVQEVTGLLILLLCFFLIFTRGPKVIEERKYERLRRMNTTQFSQHFTVLTLNRSEWNILYEGMMNSYYAGVIRYINKSHITFFPIITHHILIASGDYANESKVKFTFFRHRLLHKPPKNITGRYNILHIIPLNEKLREEVNSLSPGCEVLLVGKEVGAVFHQLDDGSYKQWRDEPGYNTILLTRMEILSNESCPSAIPYQ